MTDEFNSKLADALWALLEPRIEQKLAQFRDEIGTFDGDIDEKISDWMCNSFRIDDYNYDIYGMIDEHLDDDNIREKVTEVLGDITVSVDIK